MSKDLLARQVRRAAPALLVAAALGWTPAALAGSGANFVVYNHHMAEQGEKEIKFYSDFSNTGADLDYSAQLVELEYGVTDRWTTALYFEGVKTEGEGYEFGGWRFENRLRLFEGNVFLNPVLYVEYEQLEPEHRYKRAVTGRTDEERTEEVDNAEEEKEEGTEHEIESKLLLGQDVTDRLDVAFNWINEVKLDNGKWEFGYALGFNYALFEAEKKAGHGWDLAEVKIGAELFGGLGDNEKGLTLDPDKTQQYAGVNLKGEFANGVSVTIGGAFGLTHGSEDAILRTAIGYEFD